MTTEQLEPEDWRTAMKSWDDGKLMDELKFCRGGEMAPGGLGSLERKYLDALETEVLDRQLNDRDLSVLPTPPD